MNLTLREDGISGPWSGFLVIGSAVKYFIDFVHNC
jgi:hypothetical protein